LEIRDIKEIRRKGAIVNYSDKIERDFQACIDDFKQAEGREPSLYEFRKMFISRLKSNPTSFIFKVDLHTISQMY
jgi:hypothetical protein